MEPVTGEVVRNPLDMPLAAQIKFTHVEDRNVGTLANTKLVQEGDEGHISPFIWYGREGNALPGTVLPMGEYIVDVEFTDLPVAGMGFPRRFYQGLDRIKLVNPLYGKVAGTDWHHIVEKNQFPAYFTIEQLNNIAISASSRKLAFRPSTSPKSTRCCPMMATVQPTATFGATPIYRSHATALAATRTPCSMTCGRKLRRRTPHAMAIRQAKSRAGSCCCSSRAWSPAKRI